MPEMITVKKRRMSLWVVPAAGVLAVLMYLISNKVTKSYLLGRVMDDLSTMQRIGYFALCFILYLACMFLVELFIGEGFKWLVDRDNYLVIRKSAMEDAAAVHFYEEYKKKVTKISLLNESIMNVLMTVLLMIFLLKGGSAGQFRTLIWLVCILAILNPLDRNTRKKLDEKKTRILYADCDPVLYFDILELYQQEPMLRQEKNRNLLMQAIACYYLCDYPEMRRKLDAMQKILLQHIPAFRIGLMGLAAIDENRPEEFRKCKDELDALEQRTKMTEATRRVFQEARQDWQGRIDLASEDPTRAEAYVDAYMAKGKHPIEWMDSTFQKAWIQLCRGEKEQARANLLLVAERAGTMAVRRKAEELLRTL